MNWEEVESRWKQLMPSAKENWGKLSEDDLQQIAGKREPLVARIRQAYGMSKREAEKQIWDWGKSVERVQKKIA